MGGLAEKSRWARKVLLHGTAGLPEQVTLFVTRRCQLSCGHCFCEDPGSEAADGFTVSELERLAPTLGRFSFLSLTGGEPFLRDELPAIGGLLAGACGVSRISIPTNGFAVEKVLRLSAELCARARDAAVLVKVSIDGWGEGHDAVRGTAGSFDRAVETLKGLKSLQARNPNLRAGVLMTLSKLNETELPGAFARVRAELQPDSVGLNLARGTTRSEAAAGADVESYRTLYAEMLRSSDSGFYRAYKTRVHGLIGEISRTRRYPLECLAGRVSAVIDSSLNVFPCELRDRCMGNLRDHGLDLAALWNGTRAREARAQIASSQCWCTAECNLQMNSFFSPGELFPILAATVVEKIGSSRGAR